MKKHKKNQNGVTLIILVITITVMAILATVSLNGLIGEDGIFTKIESAKYKESIAILEEFLNKYYIENYDNMNIKVERRTTLKEYTESSSWFTEEKTIDGKNYIFIIIENLPDEVQKNITIEDSENYVEGKFVFGVTSDLQVYYCEEDIETTVGVSYTDID